MKPKKYISLDSSVVITTGMIGMCIVIFSIDSWKLQANMSAAL